VSDQKLELIEAKLGFIAEARRLLTNFKDPIWAGSESKSDEDHVKEFTAILAKTRETHPDLEATTVMNSVCDETGLVIVLTGNTPEAGQRAKLIAGLLHSVRGMLDDWEVLILLNAQQEARIEELLVSNNEKLMENRAQRETIRKLQAKIDWLLEQIPGVQAS
jgi:hypothetical protein